VYVFSFWFKSNGGSPDISRISEVQDEIRNLNVDDFQYQGEDGDRSNDEATSSNFIHINNSFRPNFNDKVIIHDRILPVSSENNDIKNKPKEKKDPTVLNNRYMFGGPSKTNRYLFILGHYEQLGKTTINFLHARYMASLINRDLVVPYVRNSRFCGLKAGWIGPRRKKSREFISMENYFDMLSIERLSPVNRMSSRLAYIDEFYKECSNSGIAMIYFIYAVNKLETKRYLHLSDSEYENLVTKMSKHNGWYDCLFIENKLHSSKRMNNIRLTQAICVDPEVIVSVNALEELVHNRKCAAIFLWRGIGGQRTHFNLTFPEPYANYLSQIEFSKLVMEEVDKFLIENFNRQSYISIQIRSERQLAWYSIKKFKQCLDLVVKVVNILILKKEIKHVFISSDLEKHGSDQISLLLNKTTQEEAKQYFHKTVKMLNAVLYKPDKSRGLIYNDAGFVALTQMEILSRSRHLVTVGDGTFQRWLVALFKKHKKKLKRSWSLTRVCATELKKAPSKNSANLVSSQTKI